MQSERSETKVTLNIIDSVINVNVNINLEGFQSCNKCYHQKPREHFLKNGKLLRYCKHCRSVQNGCNTRYNKKQKFLCNKCDREFKSEGALLNHRKEEHENIRYCCEICDKRFKQRWYLKKHVQNMHVNPKSKSMSRGEEKVKKWLEENEVEFQREATFEDLKGISGGHLRFDFVVDLGVSSRDKKNYD